MGCELGGGGLLLEGGGRVVILAPSTWDEAVEEVGVPKSMFLESVDLEVLFLLDILKIMFR